MKKIIFTLAITLISINLLSAQEIEVPQTQMSLINKIAADWCPPCGSWGWDFFHDLIDDNESNAVLFTAHHSGGLQNQVASSLTSNYGVNSQPRFILNGVDQNVLSGTTSTARQTIQEMVNQHATTNPLVQTGFDATYRDDGMIHVNAKTTFFEATEGEYYLAVYLVEKIVSAYQATQGQNAQHKQIIRQEINGLDFGSLIAMGSISDNTTYTHQFSISKGDYNTENLEVETVIWKKVDNTYEFVNANKDSDVQYEVINSTRNVSLTASTFLISPNIITDRGTIQFRLDKWYSRARLSMVDLQGRTVVELFNGSLPGGNHLFDLNHSGKFTSGVYIVRLELDSETISSKVILE